MLASFKDALVEWLRANNPPTLGQLLLKDTLASGVLFTFYTNFFCRGLPQVHAALIKGKVPMPMAEAYAKLDDLRSGWRVSFKFHHEHLTSSSAWSQLSGQKTLFVLGAATSIKDNLIEAIPWVIATPIPNLLAPTTLIGRQWSSRLEVFPEAIDCFAKICEVPPGKSVSDLDLLRNIPEREVKQAFAEIISEAHVPKDWGGERSDLFSSRVTIDGDRISAAFLFKGPAKFRPLTNAGLGKNGDQIDRLFTEPADLLVLQHCHEITSSVRGAMRAYAQQIGALRLFCLIDGHDTLRLLRAYGKCGLES